MIRTLTMRTTTARMHRGTFVYRRQHANDRVKDGGSGSSHAATTDRNRSMAFSRRMFANILWLYSYPICSCMFGIDIVYVTCTNSVRHTRSKAGMGRNLNMYMFHFIVLAISFKLFSVIENFFSPFSFSVRAQPEISCYPDYFFWLLGSCVSNNGV